eukprot:Tbor_TRINITY_DN6118_c2_g7::TRINITY_DN6118_c2_g7_i1::g.22420::m.22420
MISALRAVIRLVQQRNEGVENFIKMIKEHTMICFRSHSPVTNIICVNYFLASVRSENPLVFVATLEIAAYILKEGIETIEELGILIAARSISSPERNNVAFIANGWAVHPGVKSLRGCHKPREVVSQRGLEYQEQELSRQKMRARCSTMCK